MKLDLLNKNILITGASSGIGRQCAITFSKAGAKTILIGRNSDRLQETFNSLEGNGHSIHIVDLSTPELLEQSLTEIINKTQIHGLIHAAGIEISLPFRLHKSNHYIDQYIVNSVAGFEICRILSKKKYLPKDGASYVFISSIRGFLGTPGQLGYSASKGAIISGVKSLAIELASKNIRANSVSPGMVLDTPMTQRLIDQFSDEWATKSQDEYPLGWISTEDVANTCLFLLSDLSKKITGTNIVVDGGFSAK